MTQEELRGKLKSVGKARFVEYFELFEDYANGRCSREECVEVLVRDRRSNEDGAGWRVGSAKLIFAAGAEYEALKVVSESRVDDTVVQRAKVLMARL